MAFILSLDEAWERVGSWDPPTPSRGLWSGWSTPDRRALAEKYLTLARPAVAFLEPQGGPPALTLGGDPLLPIDMAWPVSPEGDDLEFIGEVDLSELPETDGLPITTGSLLFFNNLWACSAKGSERAGSCIHIDADSERVRRPHPPIEKRWLWQADEPMTYSAMGCSMVPNPSGADAGRLVDGNDDRATLAVEEVGWFLNTPFPRPDVYFSHLLGWAQGCQLPLEDELAYLRPGERWLSLFCLQDEIGSNQWLIKDTDLAAADFTNVFFAWDCG